MRTTLTIDDDVAVQIKRRLKRSDVKLKELINTLLRAGLKQTAEGGAPSPPFVTPVLTAGKCYLENIDNIGEVLEYAEGLWHK